jgi:anionic cell wall polymer biosynthesis LytR-Cps2A-Psr (LCP) family protein
MTITLMGRGGAGHDGGALTDTILVARILETQKRVVLVSIPRDLWVQIPYDGKDGMKSKINAAYAIGVDSKNYSNKIERYTGSTGGGNLASDVLKTVTNLSSDHYITLDFSGFEQAIDSIGGIDITVDTAFTDYEYPIAGRENLDCSTYTPVALVLMRSLLRS